MINKATLTAVILSLAPNFAFAQEEPSAQQLTPAQIAEVRARLAAQQAAQVPSPDEIETLRQLQLDEMQARNTVGYANTTQRRPIDRRIDIIGEGPGRPYPTQSLALWDGFVTSVSFFDHLGEPWPVEAVSFDRRSMAVNSEGCEGTGGTSERLEGLGNVITVLPCDFWTSTSAQVLLSGETRPLLFDVAAGSRDEAPVIDGSVTVSIQSDVDMPFGRTRTGEILNDWVNPSVRAITIDPIDTSTDRNVNAILLANGITTDISFMDRNNNPWPIAEIVFPPGVIAVNGECREQTSGLAGIQVEDQTTFYVTQCIDARATIGVRLEGRAGAISLLTVPARRRVDQPDGTITVTVPGVSPNQTVATAANAIAAGTPRGESGYGTGFNHDGYLDDFLYGTPPQGARRAEIRGGESVGAEGWFYNGALYLRGSFNIVNPAMDARGESPDRTFYVYKYGPPVARILGVDLTGREFVLNIQ